MKKEASSVPPNAAKCPVDHSNHGSTPSAQDQPKCPVDPSAYKHFLPPTADNSETEKCPVDPSAYKHFLPQASPSDKGCDSDTFNESNYMPNISQTQQSDQKMPLGLDRETSTIPRAQGSESKWIYPSEQMFFNAMRRKNWDPKEEDMPVVVPIHNAVNEQAWQKILEWESMHQTECNQPKLLKFQGRPKDITPKARFRSLFGYTLPFDRHDWTVDRCGERVTYVIDFYTGKRDPRRPEAVSFYLDVRPGLSPGGIWDRIKMSWKKGEFV
ncbi:cytochrome c/c1 heme-lyase [Radiomyces spectabilis]|uniref:cytochrome c/c1 heme-lyase n=1 Tax=Radiomyces spectabilis TaxID=64574 RepID=UPI00221FD724|nr:cytochrome c/c1 heme-lyase [Radiomyces spectabilis]KAI8366693.1 cytochrome c/c1 heme-lyase [Radiomyces spectabilis]